MIGYSIDTDDDAEPTPEVVDGKAETRELSEREQVDLFVELCDRMRDRGATEVRMGGLKAVFSPPRALIPAPPPNAQPKRQTSPVADVFPDSPDDSPEDRARKQRYRDLASVVVGDR